VLGEGIGTVQKEVEALLALSNEVGLEANAERTYITYFFIKLLIKSTTELTRFATKFIYLGNM
jgi:hypothetical protein